MPSSKANEKEPARQRLSERKEEREQARQASGEAQEVAHLTVEELEERIAPGTDVQHNETLLIDR